MVMSVPLTMSNLSAANTRQGHNRTARIAAQTEPQRPGKIIFSDPPSFLRAATGVCCFLPFSPKRRGAGGARGVGPPNKNFRFHDPLWSVRRLGMVDSIQ